MNTNSITQQPHTVGHCTTLWRN